MMKMLNKFRRYLIRKLIKPEDGYTYTGFSEGEPIKFYYQDSTDTYLLGKRSDTMYYFKPTLTSWSSVSSRYLPWGKTVDKCVFNPKTKKMDLYTFPSEPREISFKKWIYGIQDNIHKQFIDYLLNLSTEELENIKHHYRES